MIGQMVGKYRVVSRLGRGGMGTVYKAVDETLDREVAIKSLNPDVGDAEILKRFRAEAVTLARLNHPNIATLFELTEHNGELLMVMEFVRGETFDVVSQRAGPMPVERAAQLCGQVFDALAHAHRAGVVHRDLKPANLMLTESGMVKVMDFGLARMAGTEHLTNDGYMVGTPAYMSPEQVLGWEIDGRADLYAMGVVLFRLLTGQLPFKADSGIAMAHKQINDPPTPVRQLRTELSWEIEEVLTRALAKPPADRFQTADAFKAALTAVIGAAAGPSAEATPTLAVSRSGLSAEIERTMPAALTPVTSPRPPDLSGPAAPSVPVPVVVAPGATAVPAPPVSAARRMPVGAVMVGAVLLAAVAAFFVWRARGANEDVVSVHASAPQVAVAPPEVAPAQAAGTAADPPPASVATSTPSAPAPSPASFIPPVRAAAGAPPSRSGAAASAAASSAAVPLSPGAPVAAKDPGPSARPSLPAVTFGKMKLLLFDDGKSRDRDASLRLGPDGLQVLDGEHTIQDMSYQDVVGLFHSHSREPRWVTPDGTSIPVGKAGGKFSFFKGMPDWITVRTRKLFIPLRVQDDDVARVIRELEARSAHRHEGRPRALTAGTTC